MSGDDVDYNHRGDSGDDEANVNSSTDARCHSSPPASCLMKEEEEEEEEKRRSRVGEEEEDLPVDSSNNSILTKGERSTPASSRPRPSPLLGVSSLH